MASASSANSNRAAAVGVLCALLAAIPARAADEQTAQLEKLYQTAKRYHELQQYGQARDAFQKLIDQCQGRQPTVICGYAHLGLANTVHHLGDVAAAREHLAAATAIFRALSDPPGQAECLFLAGTIDLQQSRFAEAVKAFQDCRGLRAAQGDISGEVAAMRSEGQAQLALGRYGQARKLYQGAYRLAVQGDDPTGQADVLTCMGNMDFGVGLYDHAAKKWKDALALYTKSGYHAGRAHVLARLADYDRAVGRFSQALKKCQLAYQISKQLGMARGQAEAFYQVSLIYENQGLYPVARDAAEQALKIFNDIGDRSAVASCWHQIGYILARSKQYKPAESFFNKSSAAFKQLKQRTSYHNSLHELAVVYRELGRLDQAAELGKKVLKYYQSINDRGGRAACFYHLGLVAEKNKDLNTAEQLLSKSLEIYAAMNSRMGEIRARQARAKIRVKKNQTAQARKDLARAIELIEQTRGQVAGAFSERAAFFSSQLPAFEQMVALAIRPGKPQPGQAFEYAERSRARAILDLLNLSQVGLWETIRDRSLREALKKREEANNRRLADVTYALAELDRQTDPSNDRIKKKRAELNARRQAVLDRARDIMFQAHQASSLYSQEMLTELKPLSAETVQADLEADDEVMLAYYVGRDRSYAWLIPPAGGQILCAVLQDHGKPLGRAAINRQVGEFLGIAGELVAYKDPARGFGGVRRAKAKTPAPVPKDLYDLLVPKSFRARLAAARHVIIVPDGMLRQMPFEAVIVGGTANRPVYWLDKLPPIAYAPSATIWRQLRQRRQKQVDQEMLAQGDSIEMLALGSPQFGALPSGKKATPIAQLAAGSLRGDQLLVPLPGTKREVRAISELFRGSEEVFLDADATEAKLRRFAPRARYIHIASHGLVDTSRYFLYSRLALTPGKGGGDPKDDGFLTLREILMDWPSRLSRCQLAVLSACETCRGKEDLSEGVFALPHGLFFAGVPAVVASLWRVDDKSTAELMKDFYQNLGRADRDTTKADALRAAKRAIRRKYPEPFYWAPFVFMGEYR